MTYSLDFKVADIGRNLTMNDCRKSDTLNAGMLEQVLEDWISWHGVRRRDIERVLKYIELELGPAFVLISEEHFQGCFCDCKELCAIQLADRKNPIVKVFDLWDAPHENWPEVGQEFRVGPWVGKCVDSNINPKNNSALFYMELRGN